MSQKYESLAREIVNKIGGSENVSTLTHCMTRLRFALKNNSNADKKGIESLDGVINVVESGGQFQVVVGTHVEKVYEEVIKYVKVSDNENVKMEKPQKRKVLATLVDFISGTFSPIVPAIAGAGMIKALLALLIMFGWTTKESQTYYVVNFMGDAVFYFLPFFIASSAANKLKCNPYLAMVLAGILLHPNLGELRVAGDPVSLFGIPMRAISYSSSVIPIILIVWVQSFIEPLVKKIIPDAVKLIFVPMITTLVVGVIGLTVLGPIGSYMGDYMSLGFTWLDAHASWLTIFLVATFAPILVMFGIHHSLVPLSTAQITTLGYENILGPGILISNISQGAASFIIGLRTKDKSLKQIATSGGVTSIMGITEPALYGVILPKKYPLIASMIGGACGGIYAGLNGVIRYATGASGIPAIPLYIGEDISHFYNILIAIVISVVVTSTLTYIFSLKFEKETRKVQSKKSEKLYISEDKIITSPLKGELMPLSLVEDGAFSSEALGKGIAIEPREGKVVAPFDCTVATLFPSKHAIGLLSDDGVELLVHVGLNTVNLNGKYFEAFVKQGDKVTKGQTLITFELDKLKEEGYITQTPIIITNTFEYNDITSLSKGNVSYNEDLLLINDNKEEKEIV